MLIRLEFFRNKYKRWNISYITALNETNMFIINRMIVLRILNEHDTCETKRIKNEKYATIISHYKIWKLCKVLKF